jgi:hypothetical protein
MRAISDNVKIQFGMYESCAANLYKKKCIKKIKREEADNCGY